MSTSTTVTLHLLDKEYRVSCSENERAGLESSARFLDEKMQSIKKSGRVVGLDRIAVMAGLNITHDFLVENQKKSGASLNISDKIIALQNKLDFAIDAFGK
ncbi:MAG: cell division protein ZapA [Cycloclasticus pugetii]|jgi:cell division protein ZapA|uniref:Cell division protein ZapA n=1 Tax=Cycloclasticus pugetii TaxID=34068 RepID=A0AB33Z0R9_9GAMM|nr:MULTISPECIES: cell division protein ZapA [Cycloclasticus]AFT67997.1 Cell division protein ZapA [Cycloclasticus sp. P1]ATI02466.1 cell division protein ZapA [Cycloclasticus sp. PY97N]EPD12930.1 Cell division protein ZapA [Cycloclasticus pugetii]MBV1898567.1 cell division protein ZapA [Cycloclasticus sp.]MDF1829200.1 cell division protein ZapA [Cycloclasticus pugetii]|tara:strand:- start:45 stop:347 length:303 start_codon:yes stop_codon:yes gene_type:complete